MVLRILILGLLILILVPILVLRILILGVGRFRRCLQSVSHAHGQFNVGSRIIVVWMDPQSASVMSDRFAESFDGKGWVLSLRIWLLGMWLLGIKSLLKTPPDPTSLKLRDLKT